MTMKSFLLTVLVLFAAMAGVFSQTKEVTLNPKVEVYYFHPTERCPIDQSIEANTLKLMQHTFAKEIKEGTIKFQIINTDDKSQEKTIARFDINAQALYIVSKTEGKEQKNDLTHFAFSNGLSNPGRFRDGLQEEIEKALR